MTRTMPDPAGHPAHDQLLVAAHAAGDASGADLARAAALVASCPECARLHRDLRALSAALAAAPAPARARDFGITPAQAAALRRPRGWRRLLAPLSGARSAAGPLAASLAALGVAGLLLGGGLRLPLGGAGSTAALPPERATTFIAASEAAASAPAANSYDTNATGGAYGAAPSMAASAAAPVAAAAPTAAPPMPAASAAAPQASTGDGSLGAGSASQASGHEGPSAAPASPAGAGVPKSGAQGSAQAVASDSSAAAVLAPAPVGGSAASGAGRVTPNVQAVEQEGGPSLLVLGSLVLLVAGIVLGALRLAARRLAR